MQLKQGTTLQGGKYKIERCLGQGSFGITYLAKMMSIISGSKGHTSMWVDVAIKEFFMKDFNSRQPDGSLNEITGGTIVEKYKKDFKRESDNLSKMNHHGVVDILDAFEENNTCYLVMAYIDGESLDAYISKKGALPEKEALECFKQIADALHYMHCQHMLHLDLKPRNIMRDSENKTFVIDFGLSKQYDDNDEPESSTTLGQGTQGYAPLEQGAPHSGHDFPVTIDVYALGATLYKMLTAHTPPHAAILLSSPEIVKNALIAKGVSKNTMSNIQKAMSPRKEDRYRSVASLMKAFGWKVVDYPQEVILAEIVEIPSEENTQITTNKDIANENNTTVNSQKKSIIHILPSKIRNVCTLAKQNFSFFARFRYYIGISLNIVFSLYWWIEVLAGGKYDPDWDFHYSLFVQVMIALLYLCAGILEIIRLCGKISALWGLIGCNFLFWFFYMSFLATDSKTGITHMDLGIIPMLIAWITCACFTFYIDKKGRINHK